MTHPHFGSSCRASMGFTLIELLIAIAIVAILATIAMASYDFAMIKARRGAAEGCLQEAAQYMERFYTTNLTYAGAARPACSQDVEPFYSVDFSAGEPTVTTYGLQAAPTTAQNDSRCGTLTIDHRGIKGATGSAGAAGCW